MNSNEAVATVIDALEAAEVPYMLVGSLSSMFYGVPRSTHDADFVVQLGSKSVRTVTDRLGGAFRLDPQILFETVTGTTRYIIDVAGVAFRVELFRLTDEEHDRERFRRRTKVHVAQFGREVYLPTVEDVIVTKLRWALGSGRGKDREDVQACIAVQGDRIDWPYVCGWCDKHGTRDLLEEIRRSTPPI